MDQPDFFEQAESAAAVLRNLTTHLPRVGIVLGSGLGTVVDRLSDPVSLPYDEIPHFPRPTVPGHSGRFWLGRLADVWVAILQGRFHFYEGHDLARGTFPIRVFQRLDVETLILTAATGGVRPTLRPGEVICLADHLNLLGQNPLRGPNDDRFGPRFPDLTEVYSRRLRGLAAEVAAELNIPLSEGVYACLPGPTYETPAEVRMLATLGADVVGMSTVPEAIVARHAGMEVLALALVANPAAGVAGTPITHDEVLAAGREAGPRMAALIEGIVSRLGPRDQASAAP